MSTGPAGPAIVTGPRGDGDPEPGGPEAGSGLFGLAFGVLFFLGFLLLATQVALVLYARTVVTSAALDAGRVIAGSAGRDGLLEAGELRRGEAAAARRVHELLGDEATLRVLSIDTTAEVARLEVTAPKPRLLLGGGTLGSPTVVRQVTVRMEDLQ